MGTTRYWYLQQGNVGSSGLLAFYTAADVRQGFIGNVSTSAAADQGTINYSAATHAFTGALTLTNGLLSSGNAACIGYGAGAGAAVTQLTSRTTGVTINRPTGAITLFTAAGSSAWASFTVTNSMVAATDTIVLSVRSGTNLYLTNVTAVGAGSFQISFATTGGCSLRCTCDQLLRDQRRGCVMPLRGRGTPLPARGTHGSTLPYVPILQRLHGPPGGWGVSFRKSYERT